MMPAKCWGVWCRVEGGVTGTREAWLKVGGEEWIGTAAEARTMAQRETDRPKGSFTGAIYRYTARLK